VQIKLKTSPMTSVTDMCQTAALCYEQMPVMQNVCRAFYSCDIEYYHLMVFFCFEKEIFCSVDHCKVEMAKPVSVLI